MNVGVKIAALLCAVSLWLFVVAGKTYRMDVELPVHVVNLSNLLSPATHIPKSIPATVEGTGFDLVRLHHQDSSAWVEIDLNHAQLGTQNINLGSHLFHSRLQSLRLLSLLGTSSLSIDLDTRITREVPIRIHRDLVPATNYVLIGDPVLIPSTVQVSGARSVLTKVFEIPTSPAPRMELTQSDTLQMDLSTDGLPPQVTLSRNKVLVAFQVQKRKTRSILQVPVQFVGPYQREVDFIKPTTVDLELTGGESILEQVDPKAIRVFIEYSRFAVEGTDSIAPSVIVSQPIESWKCNPAMIHLVHASTENKP